ncbi:MAG: electron transport complex subunit E [Candidatus Omnitrophica bacterium]|nr:electron transport complex subunit E [Candidatus Omnitrophota bacterium]
MKEFTKGIFKENPLLRLALGLCPALAISTSLPNAIAMGLAATFVLVFSNTIVSLIRNFIPSRIRIPCYIVIIATFVVMVERFIKAFSPALEKQLGIYIPLIVVNCMILGRAEAFASKNSPVHSILDGLGMGLGFTLALCLIAFIRELVGAGTLWGINIIPGYDPAAIFILPAGALLTMGLLLGALKLKKKR